MFFDTLSSKHVTLNSRMSKKHIFIVCTMICGFRAYGQPNYKEARYKSSDTVLNNFLNNKLSTHDAQCLALVGYGDLNPTTLSRATAAFGLTQTDVATTNKNYKSGTKGTKCSVSTNNPNE